MTSIEIQDYIHVYSMFSFRDGRKMAGIVVNKYNVATTQVDYYFISQENMHGYKSAFEKYDPETCGRLSTKISVEDIQNIRPVSLADYKIIMQLMDERQKILQTY